MAVRIQARSRGRRVREAMATQQYLQQRLLVPAISPPLDWGGRNAADTEAAPVERPQPEYLRLPPPPPGAAGASLSGPSPDTRLQVRIRVRFRVSYP